jgi:hypothetical protein
MGVLFKHYLTGPEVYVCSTCKTHLSLPILLISKAFTGANGRAYLFKSAVNVEEGTHEERELLTGKHIVCDVVCIQCKSYVGWKYIKAFSRDQEYKTGAYVLEKTLISLVSQSILKSEEDGPIPQNGPMISSGARSGSDNEDTIIAVHTDAIAASDDDSDRHIRNIDNSIAGPYSEFLRSIRSAAHDSESHNISQDTPALVSMSIFSPVSRGDGYQELNFEEDSDGNFSTLEAQDLLSEEASDLAFGASQRVQTLSSTRRDNSTIEVHPNLPLQVPEIEVSDNNTEHETDEEVLGSWVIH